MTDVFLDDKFVGSTSDPRDFVAKFREDRRAGKLASTSNIYHDKEKDEINVEISRGRLIRPAIDVENGKQRLTTKIT